MIVSGGESKSSRSSMRRPFDYRVIHLVGIGGIGMSGIAEILHNLGYEVQGSDIKESETTERLRKIGIKIYIGHRPQNVDGAHVVVVSSAVKEDNPEIQEARRRAIPVIPRAEMLAEIGRLKYSILVAGAHGKTTTTSLIGNILANSGFDPTMIVGGRLVATGSNARLGSGDFLVAEADESDGSFLKLNPTISVITNIDREHLDFFKDMETLKRAFVDFANKVPFYGASIVCIDNPEVRHILPEIKRRVITYGLSEDAEVMPKNIEYIEREGRKYLSFSIIYKGIDQGRFHVPLLGLHNCLNTIAAFTVAKELGIDNEPIKKGLESFSGIKRRLEFKGFGKGITLFDDYGHHPAEIKATLRAVKEALLKEGRLIVIFQPHRYTRTRDLLEDFSTSFSDADLLFLMDIYPAGERPIEGINSRVLFELIKKSSPLTAFYISDKKELIKKVLSELKEGDLVLTLGAGDVWKIGEEILGRLK